MLLSLLGRWAKLYHGTPSELALEPAIARLGLVYRFQHPVWSCGVILDFAFPGPLLALEVDGKEHRTKAGREKDEVRTAKLELKGWTVIRCTNEEALGDQATVINRVIEALKLKGIDHGSR